ncbi:MAG TPA: hypothetical protein VNB06_11700 [Thermoanaerobaculia bacterium]|nr:hypothetical protein [Thermoanaerobaculia bacterium]
MSSRRDTRAWLSTPWVTGAFTAVSAIAAVVATLAALASCSRAGTANNIAREAKQTAESANTIAAEANRIASESRDHSRVDSAEARLRAAIADAEMELDERPGLRSAVEEARRRLNDGTRLLGEESPRQAAQTFDNALVTLRQRCLTLGATCNVAAELLEHVEP